MALFGRDYDRDYGYRYGTSRGREIGYDETYGTRPIGEPTYRTNRYGARGPYGDYRAGRGGYDRQYKSQWQTDYGDPFGDRSSRTPIRMVREDYDRGFRGSNVDYDRGYRGGGMGYERGYGETRGYQGMDRGMTGGYNRLDRDVGYDTAYNANPVSYDPYYGREQAGRPGRWNSDQARTYRTYERGYDSGWF